MKRLILLLSILALSIWVGLHIKEDPGYVLLSYNQWVLEMPLWLASVLIVIAVYLVHLVFRIINKTKNVSGALHRWSSHRKTHKALSLTSKGLIEFSEGNWQAAEKNLLKAAPQSENPLINYLAAARAAQEQGAYERRDKYLKKAHQTTPDAEMAVGLTQAQLQINHEQIEQALATLRHLEQLSPRHAYVTKLLSKLYLRLGDWKSNAALLPELRRHKIVKAKRLAQIEQKTYEGLLHIANNEEAIKEVWSSMPKQYHKDALLIRVYCDKLIAFNAMDECEKHLQNAINKTWGSDLIDLYGKCQSSMPQKQLKQAEKWLKHHKDDAELLLALGRICVREKLWGKARSYLESSVKLTPKPEAYAELGQLLEQIGEQQAAQTFYRDGLLSVVGDLKTFP